MARAFFLNLVLGLSLFSLSAFAASNVEVKIDGMTCASCVKSVTDKLSKVPNVDKASIKVVLAKKSATLSVSSADAATIEQIKKAITDAGYTVVGDIQVN